MTEKEYVLAFDTANEVIAIGIGLIDSALRLGERFEVAPFQDIRKLTFMTEKEYVLAFDTANEVIAIGIGLIDSAAKRISCVASVEVEARRASNTRLLACVDELLANAGVARESIACVAVGRGPGSFTGVRIAMATAKGVASALEVGLVGVSTLDAVAWNAQASGVRGRVLVVADAMRKEVYPVEFDLNDAGVTRLGRDRVVKADVCAAGYAASVEPCGVSGSDASGDLLITGDALRKYADLFSAAGMTLDSSLWIPTGVGLLLAVEDAWRAGSADPLDSKRHDPAYVLPVYTRLSDAEENERVRLAREDQALAGARGSKHVTMNDTSVSNTRANGAGIAYLSDAEENERVRLAREDQALAGARGSKHVTMNDTSVSNTRANGAGIAYLPLDAPHASAVAAMEGDIMGSDAWNSSLVADELGRADRIWWAAYASDPSLPVSEDAPLIGYAGGWVVDGDVQILKVGVDPAFRRRGIARELIGRIASDARSLGAQTCSLEVRAGNEGAQALYASLGFESLGVRPRYYSDGEDALIMKSPTLPESRHDVAGMSIEHHPGSPSGASAASGDSGAVDHPLVFAIESKSPTLPESRHDVAGMSIEHHPGSPSGASAASGDSGAVDHPLVFAIESSCDETAAAIVDGSGHLLADVVASQIDFPAPFGCVVPEIASRKHVEAICGVCDECLETAARKLGLDRLRWRDLDAISVTYAPGLLGALVVGVAFAKGVAWACDVPFIGVNHLEGHLYANKIGDETFAPPAVVSLVSGGNTMLVHMRDWGDYEILGATIDDAVGEAFDKVAKALGLGYPGGPVISKLGAEGDPDAIAFPRAMMHSGDLRFSLSGLKTAVVTYVNQERAAGRELNVPDICASFQQAVVDVQVSKARRALEQTGAKTFCLGGGVAANPVLRGAYEKLCAKMHVKLVMPPLHSCGDNAGMIALVAFDRFRAGKFFELDADALAHADLEQPY